MGSALSTAIALVTSTDINAYLGITVGGTEEIQTDLLINAASQLALTWTGRTTLISASLTETYPGDNTQTLLTYSYPISAVSQVYIDVAGKFDGTSGYIADSTTYNFQTRGRIVLIGGAFLAGIADTDSVQIKYTAGYSTIPYDLQEAIKELVMYWYRRKVDVRVGKLSETAGNTSTVYESDIPVAVSTVLNRYRNFMRRVM